MTEPAFDSDLVHLHDRTVELIVRGQGAPLVVLESGCGDDWSPWAAVFGPLAERSRTLAYSRPGYGRSTPVATLRDLWTEADELRQLLHALEEQPPYVLVGHSLGGLIVQAYAAARPREVAGLVLVDPTHPDQFDRMHRETPEDARTFVDLSAQLLHGVARQELDALGAPHRGHLPDESLPYGGPVIVLGASLEDFFGSRTYQPHHRILIQETAARFSRAELREIACKHYIQREQPDAVIGAVEDVLARARNRMFANDEA